MKRITKARSPKAQPKAQLVQDATKAELIGIENSKQKFGFYASPTGLSTWLQVPENPFWFTHSAKAN